MAQICRHLPGYVDRAMVATVAVIITAAAMPARATSPGVGRIRNDHPQPAVETPARQWPIHYRRGDADPADPSATLRDDFFDRHTAMEYDQAARIADLIIELSPESAEAHYNQACVLARLFRRAEAMDALDRAIDCGWRDAAHMAIDPDLQSLRAMPQFATLAARLDTLAPDPAGPQVEPWPSLVAGLHRDAPTLLARAGSTAATIVLVDDGRTVWSGSFGSGPVVQATAGRFEADGLVDLVALAALLRHDDRAPARRVLHVDRSAPPSTPTPVQRVELASSEPFVLCCRRHVVDALAMYDTRLADHAGPDDGLRLETSAADLGRLVGAMSLSTDTADLRLLAAADVDRIGTLAADLGLTVLGDPPAPATVQAGAAGPVSVVVRWSPATGRGIVVAADGLRAAMVLSRTGLGQGEDLGGSGR